MDSLKTSFYTCYSLKNSEENKSIGVRGIFEASGILGYPKTNTNAEKIISCINAGNDEKINYEYLLGWEAGKIIFPKLCYDLKYKIRILIAFQSPLFVKGFYTYGAQQYSKFETEKTFLITIKASGNSDEKEISEIFKDKVSFLKFNTVRNFHSALSKKFYGRCTYDGIISFEYAMIGSLHPKGFFLNLISRENQVISVLFNAFLFRNVMLIDNPILSELMTLSYQIQNASRSKHEVLSIIPDHRPIYQPETYEKIINDLEIMGIMHHIQVRQNQLKLVDFCSIWSSLNELFFKIKLTRVSAGDILDFSLIEYPDQNNNDNENKNNNP